MLKDMVRWSLRVTGLFLSLVGVMAILNVMFSVFWYGMFDITFTTSLLTSPATLQLVAFCYTLLNLFGWTIIILSR